MLHHNGTISIKFALIFIALVAAAAANASLLDCPGSLDTNVDADAQCAPIEPLMDNGPPSILQEAIPTQPIQVALAGFQLNQARTTGAVPESAPLLVLIGALLAVLLVRAKSHNSK
jgi:hypothetical protein